MTNFEYPGARPAIETTKFESEIEKIFEDDEVVVINEGENGVILFVEEERFNYHIQSKEKQSGDVAFKLLKLGIEKDLIQEITVHKQAQKIIAASGKNPNEIAQIPEIVFERASVTPRGKILEWCNKTHRNLAREKILMFAMDYIPGKNMGELLLAEMHKRHPRSPYFRGMGGLSELSYSSLAIAAEEIFSIHGNKDILMDRVFEFLKKDGFVLPSRISMQISRAIAELNQNGLYHRDLHWGNIMVTNWGKEDARSYIIDFGESVYDVNNSSLFREQVQKRHISDSFSVGRYTELATVSKGISEKIIEKMRKDPVWSGCLNNVLIACDLGGDALSVQFERSWNLLSDKTKFFGLIQTVFSARPHENSRLKGLSVHLAKGLSVADSNALLSFVDEFISRNS